MTAPVFVLLTEHETLRSVAVNLGAVEVVEEVGTPGDLRTRIRTVAHSVIVDEPLTDVFRRFELAATPAPWRDEARR